MREPGGGPGASRTACSAPVAELPRRAGRRVVAAGWTCPLTTGSSRCQVGREYFRRPERCQGTSSVHPRATAPRRPAVGFDPRRVTWDPARPPLRAAGHGSSCPTRAPTRPGTAGGRNPRAPGRVVRPGRRAPAPARTQAGGTRLVPGMVGTAVAAAVDERCERPDVATTGIRPRPRCSASPAPARRDLKAPWPSRLPDGPRTGRGDRGPEEGGRSAGPRPVGVQPRPGLARLLYPAARCAACGGAAVPGMLNQRIGGDQGFELQYFGREHATRQAVGRTATRWPTAAESVVPSGRLDRSSGRRCSGGGREPPVVAASLHGSHAWKEATQPGTGPGGHPGFR